MSGHATAAARRPSGWERAELLLVGGAVACTMLVGLLAAVAPGRVLALTGLPGGSPFLVRQTGVLLMVLAVGYLVDFRRSHGVVLLLTAEGLTAVFLLASWLDDRRPAQILLFCLQALLGGLTWAIHRMAERRRWARVELRLVTSDAEPYRPAGRGR